MIIVIDGAGSRARLRLIAIATLAMLAESPTNKTQAFLWAAFWLQLRTRLFVFVAEASAGALQDCDHCDVWR